MQAFLSFLHSPHVYKKYVFISIRGRIEKNKGKCNYFLGEAMPLMVQILHCDGQEGRRLVSASGSSTESWLDNLVWGTCESDEEYVVMYL